MSAYDESAESRQYSMEDLLRIMERLREPEFGCPWDLKQNFSTIVPHTLEECYELVEAIEQNDLPHIAEELGDVLFQVVFYSELGREKNAFDFQAVVDGIARKLLRRHPHVFAEGAIEGRVNARISTDEVRETWETIKRGERAGRIEKAVGALDDIPMALPGLSRAQKLQKRAASVGFDWPSLEGVLAKLEEELDEFKDALASGKPEEVSAELGDILFSVVNVTRHLALDAEAVLRAANKKFSTRFAHMEEAARKSQSSLAEESMAQLEARWRIAKTID